MYFVFLINCPGGIVKDLIIDYEQLDVVLKSKISDLKQGRTVLLVSPLEVAFSMNISLIKMLQANEFTGIYISLAKTYQELERPFQKQGIDIENLHIIDGMSRMYGMQKIKGANIEYIDTPLSIDKLAEHIQ